MNIRKPTSNSIEELTRIVRDFNDALNAQSIDHMDLKGRRITNSGIATTPDDLVPRKQLDQYIAGLRQELNEKIARAKGRPTKQAATTPGSGGLPSPTHPIDYGYWYVDRTTETDPAYGDFYGEVKGYTNQYHSAGRFGYAEPNTPTSVWKQRMANGLRRAAQDGKNIHWLIGEDTANMQDASYEVCLQAAELGGIDVIWPKMKTICISDEGITDKNYAEQRAANLRQKLAARNLPVPPNGIGISFAQQQVFNSSAVNAAGIDWIGVECYLDAPGNDDTNVNVALLNSNMARSKAAVPASKKISFIMQGYTRNYKPDGTTFNWSNLKTLEDLQIPVYLASYNDPRVFDISIFSYGRQTGTRHVDKNGGHLADRHKQIGAAILGLGGTNTLGCKKNIQGGNFNYPDMIQTAIAANQDLLTITTGPPSVVFIQAGKEGQFMDACVEVFSDTSTGWEFARHPEGEELLVGKVRGSEEYSETWAIYASDLRVRTTEFSYIETCRPPIDAF
jgi:hypothetical protein